MQQQQPNSWEEMTGEGLNLVLQRAHEEIARRKAAKAAELKQAQSELADSQQKTAELAAKVQTLTAPRSEGSNQSAQPTATLSEATAGGKATRLGKVERQARIAGNGHNKTSTKTNAPTLFNLFQTCVVLYYNHYKHTDRPRISITAIPSSLLWFTHWANSNSEHYSSRRSDQLRDRYLTHGAESMFQIFIDNQTSEMLRFQQLIQSEHSTANLIEALKSMIDSSKLHKYEAAQKAKAEQAEATKVKIEKSRQHKTEQAEKAKAKKAEADKAKAEKAEKAAKIKQEKIQQQIEALQAKLV